VICSDDYHSYSRAERAENDISALDPKGNYLDILEQHLRDLRNGKAILRPTYNHTGGTLDAPVYIQPKPYIIMEGLLGYTTRKMRDCYDVKVYLDPQEDLRVKWKVQRDTGKRGYTEEQVMSSLEKRKADSPMFIHPQRTFADIVIRFLNPRDENGREITDEDQHLMVQHILRPTLPHPNLSPILDNETSRGISLSLSRDSDGKPVDILEIDGRLSDRRAEKIEELIWALLPEASHLRQNIGRFIDSHNKSAISHPLALTQLLIAYHMIKAARGEYAV
jgi:phosphoribulokinase